VLDHAPERERAVLQDAGQPRPDDQVGDEDQGKEHQEDAHGATAGLEHEQAEDRPHPDVGGERIAAAQRNGLVLPGEIERAQRCGTGDAEVDPARTLAARCLGRGIEHEGQEQHEGQVDRPLLQGRQRPIAAGVEVEQGRDHGYHQNQMRPGADRLAHLALGFGGGAQALEIDDLARITRCGRGGGAHGAPLRSTSCIAVGPPTA
jgi:hypothetical protein